MVYTTLSTVVEKKPTKIIETVPGPTAVVTATDVQLTTLTSLCPVTETYTEGGKTWTKTYTTTSTIVTHVPTKVWQTEKLPDVTKTEKDVEYTTITSLCPVVSLENPFPQPSFPEPLRANILARPRPRLLAERQLSSLTRLPQPSSRKFPPKWTSGRP